MMDSGTHEAHSLDRRNPPASTNEAVILERFGRYAINVTQPHTHSLYFEVKVIIGETSQPEPAGLWLYHQDDNRDITTEFEEGEPFLSGEVKWDGCSNWDFHTDPVMAHFCSRADAAGVGQLLDHLYQITKDRLGVYEGD